MKKLNTSLTLTLAIFFISAMTFTSCGGKKEVKSETETELPADADSADHPAATDSSEHPAKTESTEHPA